MLFLIYFSSFLILFWVYAGYLLFLLSLKKKPSSKKRVKGKLKVTVLVPCLNEETMIREKVKNLFSLNYEDNLLDFVFVDGGSEDKTLEYLKEIKDKRLKIFKTKLRNKIGQINAALPSIHSEIVVISDVDTFLDKNALLAIVEEFKQRKVAVVGAFVEPRKPIVIEKVYWIKQNQIRLLESKKNASSIVIANCYGFRKNLLKKFPKDTIADDVYIAFWAHKKGLKTIYCKRAMAYELRSPSNFWSFLDHKLRKGDAYLKEIFRFCPGVFKRSWQERIVLGTKLLQFVFMPVALLSFILLSVKFFLLEKHFLVLVFWFNLFLATVVAGRILKKEVDKNEKITLRNVFWSLITFLTTNFIILVVLLRYPFYKQTSNYKKIDS